MLTPRRRSTDRAAYWRDEDTQRILEATRARDAELGRRLEAASMEPLPDHLALQKQLLTMLEPLRTTVGGYSHMDDLTRVRCLTLIDQVIGIVEGMR